jgi:hypothetical protein
VFESANYSVRTIRITNLDLQFVPGASGITTAYWTMDVTQHSIEASFLKGAGECACVLEVPQSDVAITAETEMKEVEILRYNRMRGSREVQRE